MFDYSEEQWKELKGYCTAKEINQQPELWLETLDIIENNKKNINDFVNKNLNKNNIRIIFTGAGTSAYVGDTVVPYLGRKLKLRVEAIATTDIVTNPENYFEKETPTILVSCARSGNSPESVAAYNLAQQLVDDINQVIITCNSEGNLAISASKNEKNLVILMPERSNDKSFAMTSSFTCMLLSSLLIFDMDNFESNKEYVKNIVIVGEKVLKNNVDKIKEIVNLEYDRIIYLGSSALKGLSREGALKALELSHGSIITNSESVLGFRHGPKSIVNDKTIVFMFLSGEEYTSKYEVDLLKEMHNDPGNKKIVAISYGENLIAKENSDYMFVIDENGNYKNDAFSALVYIIIAQVYALLYSIKLGISPDNPCPEGTVNRVVKGVNIYKYNN